MTEALSAAMSLQARPGKHNMASAAFEELRAARREGRTTAHSEVSFNDLVDTLNPLQHIPVISEIYRSLTGDTISPQARVAGGTLYGGPLGLVASIVSLAIAGNGEDGVGDRVFASLTGGAAEKPAAAEPQIALVSADTGPQETASLAASEPPPAAPRPALPTLESAQQPLPRLSSEAFTALIGSFGDPVSGTADENEDTGLRPPGDLASAMQQALDKYDALKSGRTGAGPATIR